MERWKDIPGFPGYQASDMGQVRSNRGRNGLPFDGWRVLKPIPDTKGYPAYRLARPGQTQQRLCAHQLVLLAFVGPRPAGMVGRHVLNNDPNDNRLDNLAYGTQGQNARDKEQHGTAQKGVKHPRAKLSEASVREIRARAAALPMREVVRWASGTFGISRQSVADITRRRTWKHIE